MTHPPESFPDTHLVTTSALQFPAESAEAALPVASQEGVVASAQDTRTHKPIFSAGFWLSLAITIAVGAIVMYRFAPGVLLDTASRQSPIFTAPAGAGSTATGGRLRNSGTEVPASGGAEGAGAGSIVGSRQYVIHPGTWATVMESSIYRKRQAIDFRPDHRFTATYTVRSSGRMLVEETEVGRYALDGRRLVFHWENHGVPHERVLPVKTLDDVHLDLVAPDGAPMTMTRIFDERAVDAYRP